MLEYDGQEIKKSLYKSEIKGVKNTYLFYYPVTAENAINLKGKNIVIIKSILNIEHDKNIENFYSMEYIQDLKGDDVDIFGIFNIYLKSFDSEKSASKIVTDLKERFKVNKRLHI